MSAANGLETLKAIFDTSRGRDLTDAEFRLWVYYRSWQVRGRKVVGASRADSEIAADLGVHTRTVQRVRQRLMESGFLTQQLRGPKVALYWAVIPATDPTELSEVDSQTPDKTVGSGDGLNGEASTVDSALDSAKVPPLVLKYGSTGSVSSLRSETGEPMVSHSRGTTDDPVFDDSPASEGKTTVRDIMNGVLGPPASARAEAS